VKEHIKQQEAAKFMYLTLPTELTDFNVTTCSQTSADVSPFLHALYQMLEALNKVNAL